jgi:hypothetical protein
MGIVMVGGDFLERRGFQKKGKEREGKRREEEGYGWIHQIT